jgi:hypothetical protein
MLTRHPAIREVIERQASNKQIAQEILSQLGGRQFLAMTGCKNLVYDDKSLRMKLIPNRTHAKYLVVTLNGLDLYDLKFMSIGHKAGDVIVKKEIKGICDDQLREIFEKETGLYTKLF